MEQVQEAASCHLITTVVHFNNIIIKVGLLISIIEDRRGVRVSRVASNVISKHQQDVAVRNPKPVAPQVNVPRSVCSVTPMKVTGTF